MEDGWWKGEEEGTCEPLMEAKDKGIIVQRMEEKAKGDRPSRLIVYSSEGMQESEMVFDVPSPVHSG